jgi:uncharacterized membrane protein YccC
MHQEYRTSSPASDTIGFRELRQACEISALREDLERVLQGTGALKEHIEAVVEEVRERFAKLTAEELGDARSMLPLLQFAVSQLMSIRDRARQTDTEPGGLSDETRGYWDATEPPRPATAGPAAPLPAPPIAAPAAAPRPPEPPPPAAQMNPPPTPDSWLSSGEARYPRPPASAPKPVAAPHIDWLSPPPRGR